jgi:hypothetical protein
VPLVIASERFVSQFAGQRQFQVLWGPLQKQLELDVGLMLFVRHAQFLVRVRPTTLPAFPQVFGFFPRL